MYCLHAMGAMPEQTCVTASPKHAHFYHSQRSRSSTVILVVRHNRLLFTVRRSTTPLLPASAQATP